MLTEKETNRLAAFETMIERGFKSFVESGKALAVVRDEKLYRASYKTFDEYCKERWGLERTYAHRLIESAAVVDRIVDKMLPIGNKIEGDVPLPVVQVPTTESQTRELAKVPEDEQAEVWQEVVETTATPTAAVIKAVVEKRNTKKDDKVSVDKSLPNGGKVYRHDAPMPEWYMDDNRVAVPIELYPVWRAKHRYGVLANDKPTFDTCTLILELGKELDHEPTIALAKKLRTDIAEFTTRFREQVCDLEPAVVINGKWYSRSELMEVTDA